MAVHGFTPYNALTGRQAPLLHDFERPQVLDEGDGEGQEPRDSSRCPSRLRQIAIQAILEGTSKDRLNRALRSKARPTGESKEFIVGDLVGFWRAPVHKDQTGWLGPGRICSMLDLLSGRADVRWQGRVYNCEVRHVRKALALFSYYATLVAMS